MRANGSIQGIDEIPDDIKELYRTVWELSMKDIIDMSRQRGYFIDQSQSLNLFMEGATFAKLTSMHFYAWKSGLKTGMYYLRTKSAVDAIKFTLNNEKKKKQPETEVISSAKSGKTPKQPEQQPVSPDSSMSREEMQALIKQSREASDDDDCLMCGS